MGRSSFLVVLMLAFNFKVMIVLFLVCVMPAILTCVLAYVLQTVTLYSQLFSTLNICYFSKYQIIVCYHYSIMFVREPKTHDIKLQSIQPKFMPYTFKYLKLDFLHLKRGHKTLKSVKEDLIHLKRLTFLNTSSSIFYTSREVVRH